MDQDRRDAAAWAKEWQIRQKNRRLLMALGFIALLAMIGYMIYFTIVHVERTTFKSVEDMRKAMQGRYAIERDYEDILIEGDEITLTYMSFSHYDREFAEKYGYDYSGEDSVYDDHIEEWDYRNGVIRTQWMGDIIVDKNGNIRRGDRYYSTFFRTDKPRPEPIDPSTLSNPEGDINADISAEDEQLFEEREEIIESTEDAAEDAVPEGENDVQT
ncbi:MAG: hypothetical protein IKG19_06030 [Lachnospiraceae bacterium]|nr:hypothetical protein [Lachnospiraceae bacterium]